MLRTEVESIVRRNAIVYLCPTPDPAQALLFGNGPMGGSLHTPDESLYLLIGRCDTWNGNNKMGSIAAVRIRGPVGLFAKAKVVRQECNLYEANIRIRDGDMTFTITCLRGRDVIVVDIDGPHTCTATIESWHDGDETTATETAHVNRTSVFDEMNRKVGLEPVAVPVADPLLGRAWGLFVDHSQPRMLLIATACSMAGVDVVRQTGRTLLAEARTHAKAWLADHARYWREFWSRSYISLSSATGDAEYEERLWYVTLYTIACGSGGGLPLLFNGGAYLLDKDARSWDGEYVYQNMREIYWPLFAAGHCEFMPEFFRLYSDNTSFVRAQTKSRFGASGLCFREAYTLWGCDVSPDNGHTQYYFSSNLECCLLMEWYHLATHDIQFLREKLLPLLKGVLEFYMSYAKKGDDGRYHLATVNALETWWKVMDDMPDMCGLHHFLPRAIAWGKEFGENTATITRWEEFLQNLAPIPVGRWTVSRKHQDGIHAEEHLLRSEIDPNGLFLPAAGQTQEETLRCNMENAELYIIFPWGRVGMDSPPGEVRRAENTWNHRTWQYINNGWAQDAVQLARMGWAERAKAAQLEHASRHQRFPNGCFISPAPPKFHGLLTDTPYFDAAGVHMTALNEMLLQSYDGVIRIAPTVSTEWSGAFKLHAFGGFEIEARFEHGQPVIARITATRDSLLKVKNYRHEKMCVEAGVNVSQTWTDYIFERALKAGASVNITWEGVIVPQQMNEADRPEMIYPGYKLRPLGAATRSGHWHDESTGHGQVGLEPDGTFPATRKT